MTTFDVSPLSRGICCDDPAPTNPHREDHRNRRPVEERTSRRLFYWGVHYLRRHGYRVIPLLNHRGTGSWGEASKSLAEVRVPVDIVNVFRAPNALPAIAEEAVAAGARSTLVPVFRWYQ